MHPRLFAGGSQSLSSRGELQVEHGRGAVDALKANPGSAVSHRAGPVALAPRRHPALAGEPGNQRLEQGRRRLGWRSAGNRARAKSAASPRPSRVRRTPLATKLSPWSASRAGSISTSTKPCCRRLQAIPAAGRDHRAVLADPDAEALALLGAGDHQAAEAVRGIRFWSTMPLPKSPMPSWITRPGWPGRRRRRSAGPPRPSRRRSSRPRAPRRRHWRRSAPRPGIGAGDGAQHLALLAAVQQGLDQADLVAAAEQDAGHPAISPGVGVLADEFDGVDGDAEIDGLQAEPVQQRSARRRCAKPRPRPPAITPTGPPPTSCGARPS